jgi:hypothetical protein
MGRAAPHKGRALHRGNTSVAELLPTLNEKNPGKTGVLAF